MSNSDNHNVKYLALLCSRTDQSIIGSNIKYIQETFKLNHVNEFRSTESISVTCEEIAIVQAIKELRMDMTGLSDSESRELCEFLCLN